MQVLEPSSLQLSVSVLLDTVHMPAGTATLEGGWLREEDASYVQSGAIVYWAVHQSVALCVHILSLHVSWKVFHGYQMILQKYPKEINWHSMFSCLAGAVLMHSPLTAATRVRYSASACEMVMWSPSQTGGFPLGTRVSSHMKTIRTSVPTSMINISCITCFVIIVN